MKNLDLWEKVRTVPESAKKTISGGRLKGKTDINPMWRIKTLTEHFGLCGIGWKQEIVKLWVEDGSNKGERVVFAEVNLYINIDGKWSEPIPGTGGSMFVAKESGGLYVDDEAYKKAVTDALSVCCKLLGIGADVYWEKDSTKYSATDNAQTQGESPQKPLASSQNTGQQTQFKMISDLIKDTEITIHQVKEWICKKFKADIPINELTEEQFNKLYTALDKSINEVGNE